MKKQWLVVVVLLGAILTLGACGGKKEATDDKNTITVGASPTPHAEILEHVKPILKEKGIELKIQKFDDYILPNKALQEKEIDANYFQHIPYYNKQVKENNYDFDIAGKIHVEPMGLYSKRIKGIKELKDGATVLTSNSESDWGRILTVLKDAKLITLKDGVDAETATFDDIKDNPKKLKFKHDVNPELLTSTYKNDEADLVAINANFATGIDLNPLKDSVLLEKDNSPYVNIIAVRKEDKDNKNIQELVKVLKQKDVQDWILKKWNGSVKPVN